MRVELDTAKRHVQEQVSKLGTVFGGQFSNESRGQVQPQLLGSKTLLGGQAAEGLEVAEAKPGHTHELQVVSLGRKPREMHF